MYAFILTLHSLVRWIIVIAALAAVIRGLSGLSGRQAWSALDQRLGVIFTSAMDTQLLLGLLLYFFLSPITTTALRDMGGAMACRNGDPALVRAGPSLLPLATVALMTGLALSLGSGSSLMSPVEYDT